MTRKNLILGGSLVCTLIAVYFAPPIQNEEVSLSSRPARGAELSVIDSQQLSAGPKVLRIRPRDSESDSAIDAFTAVRWAPHSVVDQPSIVKDVVNEPEKLPEVKSAPPLPYKVLGKYIKDGQITIFLQHDALNFIVHVGDVIEDHYKIESLENGILTLNYLPLNQQQTLNVGTVN